MQWILESGGGACLFSGTPTTPGSYSWGWNQTDSKGTVSGTGAVTITINPPLAITTTFLPAGKVGVAYSAQIQLSGGTSSYTWSGGPLPPGLAISSSGLLSGKPTQPVAFSPPSVGIVVSDGGGGFEATTLAIFIAPAVALSVSCNPSNGPPIAGAPYSASCTASGGAPPYSWGVGYPVGLQTCGYLCAEYLPPGLVFSSSGATATISGTPTSAGSYLYAVNLIDSVIDTTYQQYSGTTAAAPPLTLTCNPSAGPTSINSSYSANCRVAGGIPGYRWAITAGSLPSGMSLNANGTTASIGGTPTTPGPYSYTVGVYDSSTQLQTQAYSGTLISGLTMSCNSAIGPSSVGTSYSASCAAAGGVTPYTWSILGTLPKGLLLNTTGSSATVSGAAATTGTYSYSVKVVDSSSQTQTQAYNGAVASAMTMNCSPSSGPSALGVPYSATCTTSGGAAPFTWTMPQGAFPSGISLNPNGSSATIAGTPTKAGTYQYLIQAADASAPPQTQTQSYSGTISSVPSKLTASPTALTFSAQPGGINPPSQSVSIFASPASAGFTAAASGGSWLTVNPLSGTAPGSVIVSVNPALVTAGAAYNGSVTITAQGTTPGSITIPVTFTVAANTPPVLGASPAGVTLNYVQGSTADQQSIQVQNTGGGTATFTSQALSSTCAGGSWLTLISGSGSAKPGTAGAVSFEVNPAGLPAGTCAGQIVVSNTTPGSSQNPVAVPVTMVITGASQSMVLSQTAMNFTVTQGGTAAAQAFGILNSGLGSMQWNISACTLSTTGSCNSSGWLSVSPLSGSSVAGSPPPLSTVSVNPQSLAPGQYFATLTVTAPQADNSPKTLVVALTVLPTGEFPPPQAWPGSVILGGVTGAVASNTQSLTLTNFTAAPLTYTSTVATLDGTPWLQQAPVSGTIPANSSVQMTVVANLAGLGTGLWYGTIAVAFSDGTIQSNPVLLVLNSAAGSGNGSVTARPDVNGSGTNCSGSTLVLSFIQPSNPQNFVVTANAQNVVQVQAYCSDGKTPYNGGGSQSNATVTITTTVPASGAKPPQFTLSPPGTQNGIWTGTWTPPAAATGVKLQAYMFDYTGNTASGLSGNSDQEGTSALGTVIAAAAGAAQQASVTTVENGAGYDQLTTGQITPGAWVVLKGSGLFSGQPTVVPTVPYSTNIGNTQVQLQGQPLPLYYASTGQVNALIPQNVASGNQTLTVLNGGVPALGGDVQVVSVQPGIFSINGGGTLQGSILIVTGSLAGYVAGSQPGQQPVPRGQYISIYCTGLGAITGGNLPPDGAPTPSTPLLYSAVNPVVTIGGVQVTPSFSGLAPGLVGVYEVNAQVPANVTPGSAVSVSLTLGGVQSNTVTIAVQ